MADIVKTENCVNDIKAIIEQGRQAAYSSVNLLMIQTYWNIGKRIVEEEQKGDARAEYGKQLIDKIAVELRKDYGNGFGARYLRSFRQFYLTIPDYEIWKSRFPNLMWTRIFRCLRLENHDAIRWYLETSSKEMWSVRTLDRNISTQYYERHLQPPVKKDEEIAANKLEIIKNPVVAEFLGFKQDETYSENQLESAITHLRDFIMEMGQGFAFMKRLQLIRTSAEDYFIDLVFYNVILKCYVLIDLKVGKVTHQDVGQMDMYVRMYDELKRTQGDNPTIGIVLCSETDEDIAKYSILNGNDQIFATKFKLYLPTEEQLRTEIEKQKQIFYLQHPELKKDYEQD